MPEGTQKPFRIPSPFSGIKKASVDRTRALFRDLRGLAVPAIEGPEIPVPDGEKKGGNGSQPYDLVDSSVMPTIEKVETPELEKIEESMTKETKTNVRQSTKAAKKAGQKRLQSYDLNESTVPAIENLEPPRPDSEKTGGEVQTDESNGLALTVSEKPEPSGLASEKASFDGAT